ncbi:docking protein 2 [Colossoma macropomum]|uniref:docking protein 2 n=1 Tax=Colossoma macropomum TaxID=42526 RepID=UPI001863E89D|nr:docking protein 2 [Colossoma macropomum]
MDTLMKRGEVYLQHHKHSEKWKRYWLNLYPGSRHGVARLELTETSSDRSPAMVRRQPDRKVVRLSDCISVVRLPPHAEAHPGDNMAAFCVETDEKRLVFAVEKEECGEWVEKICDIAFQKGSVDVPKQLPQMSENQIYGSREEVFEFWVTVQQLEASARCGLKGAYWLQAGEDALILKDKESRQSIMEWPYKLLRRYGRDKTMFSIEAGRRCYSGPGTFNFETKQSDEILRLVELAIHQQKSLPISAGSCSPRSPCSPLPRRPISASLLDVQTNSSSDFSVNCEHVQFNPASALSSGPIGLPEFTSVKPTTYRLPGESTSLPEPVYSTPVDLIGLHKGDDIRFQQTVKNGRPSHHHSDYSEPEYADPADVIRPNPNAQTHSNPADTVKISITTPTSPHHSQPEPVYSEVCHVTPNQAQEQGALDQHKEEPIYSLPITASETESKQDTDKMDKNMVIYSKVNKAGKSTKPQDKTTAHRAHNVISENLGLI